MTTNQPQYIRNVAIIGGTGKIGSHFLKHIVAGGKHNVTVLARSDSKSSFDDNVTVVRVDYDSEESITNALRGQDFLAISLATSAPPDVHGRIVAAAAKAGVPYVMPNHYGFGDGRRTDLLKTDPVLSQFQKWITDVEKTEGIDHVILCCGFWYEFSLSMGEEWYGFDIKNRKVTFYDDGKTKINTSTWEQCGRGLAALLQLPLEKQDGKPSFTDWKNKTLRISSFHVSQRDMLDSLNRVLGTTDADWTIAYQDVKERHQAGLKEMQSGSLFGFVQAMYAAIFIPGSGGDYEADEPVDNEALGLPKEDLDEATKRALDLPNARSMMG